MTLVAKDIMTDQVLIIKEDSSVYDGIKALINSNINCLPVVDDKGFLRGMISETDLVYIDKKLNPSSYYAYGQANVPVDPRILQQDLNRLRLLKIKEIMTTKLITVKEEAPLEKIIDIIINKGIKTIPVSKAGKVIGIITRKNILRYYLSQG